MIYTIENENIRVSAETQGAQLKSIFLKSSGTECLWQGNPDIWYGRAPILFPVIGQLLDGKYRYNTTEYEMPKHGFARRSEFAFKGADKNSMTFLLESNDETRKCYPFDFELLITYSVDGAAVKCTHTVINKTDGEMYFSIGAHPGFNCRIGDTIEFEKPEELQTMRIDKDSILTDTLYPVPLKNGRGLQITKDLFCLDALILHSLNSESLTLKTENRNIKFTFGSAPYLGIWAKPNAPYVCIEPWYGVNDSYDKKESIAQKTGINRLEKGERFAFEWTAEITE